MCPAPGQITVILCVRRAATSQPGRIAANLFVRRQEKSVAVTTLFVRRVSTSQELLQIYLSGGHPKISRSDRVRRAENTLKYLFAKIRYWFYD